jgi:hypothetical protein
MGTIYRAICEGCAYSSADLLVGVGMMEQRGHSVGHCRYCAAIVPVANSTRLRCPKCRRKPEVLGAEPDPDSRYECPRCNADSLRLELTGCWN